MFMNWLLDVRYGLRMLRRSPAFTVTAVKKDFQAVKGRKKKDGTTGKAYVRKKAKRKSDSWF